MITGSNLKGFGIGVNAFLAKSSNKYIDDKIIYSGDSHSYDPDGTGTAWEGSGHWIPADSHQYYWPKANNLDFWAWAPYDEFDAARKNTSTTNKPKISSFAYGTYNESISFVYDLGVSTAAVDMPDLVFAKNLNLGQKTASTGKGDGAGCVPLEFKHALAAVKFVISSEAGCKLKSIEIGGAVQTATCTYPDKDDNFAWTNPSSLASDNTFKQTFDDPGLAIGTSTSVAINDDKGNNTAVFMMIPQTLVADTQKVKLTFDYGTGTDVVYTGDLKQSISAWEAGKVYTYTIKLSDGSVDITVDDTVTTTEKSNLVIKNEGNTNAYVRATIVANWVNNAGRIVSPWKDTDGSFTNLCTSASNWVKVGDYYYQKNAVAPNATAPQLFEKYTVTTTKTGVHLEMEIVVQAITATGYTDYKDAWKKAAGLTL